MKMDENWGVPPFMETSHIDHSTITSKEPWHMGVSENRLNPIVPNGFADHYPYEKWLFHWEY